MKCPRQREEILYDITWMWNLKSITGESMLVVDSGSGREEQRNGWKVEQ